MNRKLTLVSLAVSSALAGNVYADINDILITEYLEGNDYITKAIEISNLGDTDYTFDEVGLYYSSYSNLVQDVDGNSVLNGETVKAGSSIVVIRSDAPQTLLDAIPESQRVVAGSFDEVRYNSLNMSGDDAVWLGSGSNGADIHDIVGTNSSWETDTKAYRRVNTSQTPSATVDLARLVASEADLDFSDLGTTTFVEPAAEEAAPSPCTDNSGEIVTIEEVQGSGSSSPLLVEDRYDSGDNRYEVTGIVTQVSTSLTKGFYMQEVGSDPLKSDGIFVSTKNATSDMVGKQVCVYGQVKEYYNMTQLVPEDDEWEVTSETTSKPDATALTRVTEDESFQDTLERFEGMLVTLPEDVDPNDDGPTDETSDDNQTMRVSRTFSFDYDSYRNNMVLAYKRPNLQPNQENPAGSQASQDQSAQNDDYRLYVETDARASNGEIPYHPITADNAQDDEDGYIRIDDSVIGLEGVLHYSYDNFRLVVNNEEQPNARFVHNTDRTSAPDISSDTEDGKFALKLATQNVLNLFNSPYGGAENQFGDNRGAESEYEFERQLSKIVKGIYALDADILGLMEVENNGFGERGAISQLVEEINKNYDQEDPADADEPDSIVNKYVFVGFDSDGNTVLDDEDHVGSDAIMTGIIYRPTKVALVSSDIITMPSQKAPPLVDDNGEAFKNSNGELVESGSNYQRDTVVAKFRVNGTGKTLSFAVNHLKSKGSTCYEDWLGWEDAGLDPSTDDPLNEDFQGNCEHFRVSAAQRLGSEMAKIGGDQVIVGDMNSYAYEDPMLLLTSNPTGKKIKSAAYTVIDGIRKTGSEGQTLSNTYGYINAVELKDKEKDKTSWSYSWNDEIGSLDHILITPSLESRVIDAGDWHVNAAEMSLYSYSNKYTEVEDNDNDGATAHKFYADTAYRSSDHDPAIITLAYEYNEAGERSVLLPIQNSQVQVTYVIPADVTANEDDVAELEISPMPADTTQLAIPTVTISDDGQKTATFNVTGLSNGEYTFTMRLRGNRSDDSAQTAAVQSTSTSVPLVAGSEVSVSAQVAKADSLTASPVAPEYDGTGGSKGGSLGILSMLGLLGFGAMRRKSRK